eukprot:TRINITY_DN17_c0_g1_i7.p1 TRINITY_DN17_c0_g1~~TRINITY_DN17_c0_g1_i7.p1  ORF type:complete len:477 (-),score=123.28 TRINITY_DN17_c0_g1_i7:57-1460(-)
MTFRLTINGKQVAGAALVDVINPATGQPFAKCPAASRAQLDEAVAAARRAFPGWAATPLEQRRKALLDASAAVEAKAQEIAAVLTNEQGKPLANALGEIKGCRAWMKAVAALDIPIEKVPNPTMNVEVHRRPIGVVGCITPWNFPAMMAVGKIAPAVYAGNTVVVKPSPYTPLSTLMIGEIIAPFFPPGVINVLAGDNELGQLITEHPGINKISFTGSGPTGKRILQSSTSNLKRVTLELGGNDAAIVLPDANLEETIPKLFMYAFLNSGQVCIAIKRLYVHESIYDKVCAGLVAACKAAKMGPGTEDGVDFGPINNKMQLERVSMLVEDAKKHGARVLCGGVQPAGPGYFYPLTVLADVREGMRVVDEEQFGPVLPVLKFRDEAEVLQRANHSPFGLGGSVWTSNVKKGVELASQLESGGAWVNDHMVNLPNAPFGGFKQSGLGRENGSYGLDAFLELQTLTYPKL